MAMEEVLDSVRRIIHKWVNTTSRITSDVARGDTIITITNARRFKVGDQVMLKNDTVYETGLIILSIDLLNHCVTLATSVLNDWTMAENTVLIKTIYEQFVQGIYIGDPDVISRYPAITVNGISRNSEWFTLESTKERYQIEIGVFVKASTHENGYRFLLNITDEIQKGLKYNILPLIDDYDITSLAAPVTSGDFDIRITNRSLVDVNKRILLEDATETSENWVIYTYTAAEDPAETSVRLKDPVPYNLEIDGTSVIVPRRFIFNSWPKDVQYGTIHKGELLKAAKISWFAEEEEMQRLRRDESKLR